MTTLQALVTPAFILPGNAPSGPSPEPSEAQPEPVMPLGQFLMRVGLAVLVLAIVFTAIGILTRPESWPAAFPHRPAGTMSKQT
jgi:hypothetical protein